MPGSRCQHNFRVSFRALEIRLSSRVDTLYTFWDNITHYKAKSATKSGMLTRLPYSLADMYVFPIGRLRAY